MRKINSREEIAEGILVSIMGILLSGTGLYYVFTDRSPYGRKDHFPTHFYGKKISPDDLHPALKEAYFSGYADNGLVMKILEGNIANIEPQTPSTR